MKQQELLRPGERLDDLIKNGLMIIQKADSFCFALDAVLLANFVTIRPREKIVDLGTGNGVIPLLLAARESEITVTGIDIQEELIERARRSVSYNHLENKITLQQMDIKDCRQLGRNCFDVVISNPPYEPLHHGKLSSERAIALARHEVACCLEDVMKAAAALLRPKGRLALVYPAKRLAEVMAAASRCNLEPKRLALVYPALRREANLFLLEAVKDGRMGLQILKPLIVYEQPGQYSQDILDIYFSGKTWE